MSKLSLNNGPSVGRGGKAWLEGSSVFLCVILIALISLVGWAYHFEVDKVVRVEGKIIPAGRSRQLQHFEGGIVSSIQTYEGATVKKGELLMVIEDSKAEADLNEKALKLEGLVVRSKRLRAEARGTKTLHIPAGKNDPKLVEAEKLLFQARQQNLKDALLVHEEEIRQYKAALIENEARAKHLKQELAVAQKRTKMFESMIKQHAASQVEVLDAQSREQSIQTQLSDALHAVPKMEAAIREEKAQLAKLKTGFRSDAQKELTTTLIMIKQLEEVLTAAKDRKRRTEIRSPMDGVINRLGYNTVGAVVKAGQGVLELTPTSDEILIEAKARPQDRANLVQGVPAVVRVSAYDTAALGSLKGNVSEVSADTVADAQGMPFYRVKVSVNDVPPSYQGHALLPGMMVTADLVTGKRTILNYLTSPVRKYTNAMFRDPR